ncbi:LysE family translocator [Microvirga terricola]|uniref:LysE family translocator n=1 Tax=Microvirga terricola TaxID=2719797 RepID=A0ABX0VDP3_9HYPH|nr:LysE family translocator [Microvirga terricola]NIX77613.1 LysE family translocator [Microvirga terricola]
MDLSLLLSAGIAGFVYGITPGPGVLAVLGIGADRGRKAGAAFLTGHLAGDVLWSALALVAIIGVTTIGSFVFDLLGAVSGLYLFWLGWRAIRVKRNADGRIDIPVRRPLLHGLTFGMTNPKAYPVAVATLTALLSAKASSLTWGMLPALLVASCVGGILAYAILVAIIGASAVRRTYRRYEIPITRISGLMFIGFALNALFHSAPGLFMPKRA